MFFGFAVRKNPQLPLPRFCAAPIALTALRIWILEDELVMDYHLGFIHFVPFIPHHLFDGNAQGWFSRTFRYIAVPVNHFFASFDSKRPLGLFPIPRDFHSIYPHDCPPILCAL